MTSQLACLFYDWGWLLAILGLIGVAIWFPIALARGIGDKE